MRQLTIDPAVPFVVPPAKSISIVQVGAGGTGSFLLRGLARLARHCRDTGGPELNIYVVDADVVEPKNVGRQLFGDADVGKNKAQVLSARLNAVFGIQICAIPQMLEGQQNIKGESEYGILVGAVDNAAARRAMGWLLGWYNNEFKVWVDCGNEEHAGQVCAGTTMEDHGLQGCLSLRSVCSALPAAPMIYPNLLVDPPPRPREDCAAAVLENAQSLNVNEMIAGVATQYLYQLVVARRLTTYRTTLDLASMTMSSRQITAANIEEDTGVSRETLERRPQERRRKAS
ncbi:MAG TPA: PRTRC system ThiF family protein [Roseiflexaceae bacterium]|nr:PRTRC system ThiF family protein [Roseiflexaceae bacterium]